MACKPQYKGKRYNSLEELYKANGVTPQQKQQAQQLYSQYLESLNTTELYSKLGNKTESGNVKVVKNIFANKDNEDVITAFRVNNKLGLLESFKKYNAIGNPINWQDFKPRFEGDNAAIAFMDWFLGRDYTNLEQEYRQEILSNLDNLKGKIIEYYKELGRPSHATALDYLVNHLGSKQDIEQFKSWLDNNQSDVQYQKQIDLQAEQDSVLEEFANSLSERFNISFDLVSEEKAKSISPEYANEPAFFDPKTKKAYLVKGKANKTSAIHEIFTHPFLLQIEKTNPTLYKNLLKEAKNNKSVVDYVDNLYGTNQNNDHEYIARAIDLAVQGELDQQKDKTLLERIQDFFNQLYDYLKKLFNIPEVFSSAISPNITLQQLAQFAMYGKGKMNLNPAQENIEYSLKATSIIVKNLDKIKQWEKNKSISEDILWNKIQGLGVPKEQLELVKNSEGDTVEEKLLDFANQYSYTVEINTATKNEIGVKETYNPETGEVDIDNIEPDFDYIEEYDDEGNIIRMKPVLSEKGKKQLEERPSQQHSELTVNEDFYKNNPDWEYRIQQIVTPDITPSIQVHNFGTEEDSNKIGWFRAWYNKKTGEVHVLEVQSDLFQKGRDKKDLITNEGNVGDNLLLDKSQFEVVSFESFPTKKSNKGFGTKQFGYSEIFEDDNYYYTEIDNNEYGRIRKSEFEYKNSKENQFLQLLNKDNNWVTFFIKSIIQDSAKKGYEKVLFPTSEVVSQIQKFDEAAEKYSNAISKLEKDRTSEDNFIISEWEKDFTKRTIRGTLNFYNNLRNTLDDLVGGNKNDRKKGIYKLQQITDEYGNTWNEVIIDENRDNQNIVFQKTPQSNSFQQFQQLLNNPNTNPTLQGNQEAVITPNDNQELLYKLNDIFEDRTSLIFNINNNKDFDTNNRLKAIRSLIDNKEVNYNNHLEHLEEYLELFEHLPVIYNLINKYGSKQAILEVYDNDNGSGNNNLQQEFIEAVNGLKSIFRNVNKTKLNSLENWLDENIVDINKIDIQDKDDNVLYPTEQYSLDVNNEKFIKYYYELSGKKEDIITFAKRLKSTIATYKLLGYNNDKILEMLKCL